MRYNTASIMQHLGNHVDAMSDPMHPLATHPFTAYLHDQADASPHITDTNSLMSALSQHVNALNDPSHPAAGYGVTSAIQGLADHLGTQGQHFGITDTSSPITSPMQQAPGLSMKPPITSPMGFPPVNSLNMNNPITSPMMTGFKLNTPIFSPMGSSSGPAPMATSQGPALQSLQRAMNSTSNRGAM